MLPHILHSTTRAVAVVQNQSHTLRNVLQLQSSGPSSGSGSSWGNGPGPGGAKHNAGSRFYSSYNSAGRAVTQANAVTSQDGPSSQTDENNEDYTQRRPVLSGPPKRQRMRSSSVSMGVSGRTERGEKMGILKTVQLHTQQKHTFAPVETLALAKAKLLAEPVGSIPNPLLVRRNSTSAPLSPLLSSSTKVLPEHEQSASGPAALPPTPPPDAVVPRLVAKLDTFSNTQTVLGVIRKMLASGEEMSVEVFNAALFATIRTRPPGHPLTEVVKLYNTMLQRSVVPNAQTFEYVMSALLTRDLEVHQVTTSLEMRLKRAPLVGRDEAVSLYGDQARIKLLKEEDNFPTALSLFEGALAIGARDQIPYSVYHRLLVSCCNHTDVNAAIHVFAQLESVKNHQIGPLVYQNLILTFANAQKTKEAEDIFQSYLDTCKAGRLRIRSMNNAEYTRRDQIMVWNAMIEAYFRAGKPDKAIGLVEQIMNSRAGDEFLPEDIPIASSSTFATVIAGFINSQDIPSALTWFDQLLDQERTPADPYMTLGGKAMRPNSAAWHMMLDELAAIGNLPELNRLYTIYKASKFEDQLQDRDIDRVIIYRSNMKNLATLDHNVALQTLQFLLDDLADLQNERLKWKMTHEICREFVSRGVLEMPCALLGQNIVTLSQDLNMSSPNHLFLSLQNVVKDFSDHVYNVVTSSPQDRLPFSAALALQRMALVLSMPLELKWAPIVLHSYGQGRSLSLIPYSEMDVHDWSSLLLYAAEFESHALANEGTRENIFIPENFEFRGISTVLYDISDQGFDFNQLDINAQRIALDVIDRLYGVRGRQDLFQKLRPSFQIAANQQDEIKYESLSHAISQLPSPTSPSVSSSPSFNGDLSAVRFDRYHSQLLMQTMRGTSQRGLFRPTDVWKAYTLFRSGLEKNYIPHTNVFSYMIEQFGRSNELEKVVELYTVAQTAIARLPPSYQRTAWFGIENSMIIALGHSGRLEGAHSHRLRILEQGGCPTHDAYGVLIQHVKDTTDDSSAALTLFNEAIEHGVLPNIYLYNNIISKLSKARKIDHALELFQQMKASGITPSSITYGAMIGACARVGDVPLARALFSEMTQAPDFKPRIPPYNTMMQMHTTTKPDRYSVLYYLDEMTRAGVNPTAHTYKLLLDAYGTIEPVDLEKMESVFDAIRKNEDVELTGAHFASLINAYGCVKKDLDKAISVFESIRTIPGAPTPDALVFEAMINAITVHKRTDLIPLYISKMTEAGVHMTAYIANFLIKGYANVNGIDQARMLFESLVDPPTGVAAPNNHAPHDPSNSPEVPVMEPVYREPSTWEAMVRAELGAGNRPAALALLERLKERQYPEAVYNRISGILTDHSNAV